MTTGQLSSGGRPGASAARLRGARWWGSGAGGARYRGPGLEGPGGGGPGLEGLQLPGAGTVTAAGSGGKGGLQPVCWVSGWAECWAL